MPLQPVTEPTAEPIHLDEAKKHVRETTTSQDSVITSLIAGARQDAETETQRSLIATRWKLVLDSFPGPTLMGVPFGRPFSLPADAIILPRSPLIQVVSIKYLDTSSTLQTLDPSLYTVDDSSFSTPPRITPIFGQIWPVTLPQIGAVQVTFDAGYAAPITADAIADTITLIGWKALAVDDAVRFYNSGGALPAPLAEKTDYYVQAVVSSGVYKLATSAGGVAIDITTADTGQSFLGVVPEGIRSWMKLRIGSLYENREEIALGIRGAVADLPYVDRMLDRYRVVM